MDLSVSDICCNLYGASPERRPCTDEIWLCHPALSTLGANWQFYHANFCKLRQSQDIPWDQIHSELWLRSHSFRDKPTTHPKRAKHEGPNIPNGYSWKVHRGIHCPGCSFKHQCFRCGQSHPIVKCQQPKQSAGQGKKPNVSNSRSTPNISSG